jgi:hypothetical protein
MRLKKGINDGKSGPVQIFVFPNSFLDIFDPVDFPDLFRAGDQTGKASNFMPGRHAF